MSTNMKIILATGNKNKLREVKEILPDAQVEGISSDAEETGTTFKENAEIKAMDVVEKLHAKGIKDAIVIADDSGLVIDALNGEPGIYSARYMGEDTSYDIKNQNLIDRLAGFEGNERAARFVCAICAIMPNGERLFVEETMEGEIAKEIKGTNGFGYDPILYLPEYGKNSAELSPEQKNAISHRGKALRKMASEISLFESKSE